MDSRLQIAGMTDGFTESLPFTLPGILGNPREFKMFINSIFKSGEFPLKSGELPAKSGELRPLFTGNSANFGLIKRQKT